MTFPIITPIWKPVVGFESFYSVSDTGLVFSKGRTVTSGDYTMKNGVYRPLHKRSYRPRIMTQRIDRYGYYHVHLRIGELGINRTPLVHRLVADAFIGLCPEDKSQINHKDSDKTNNHVDNLEWVTNSENHQHSYKNGTHALNLYRCPKTGRNMGSSVL